MFVLRVEIPSLWCWISQPSTIWWTYCQPHVPCSSAMVYFPKGMGEFFLSIVRIPLKMLCRSKTPSSIMFWPWHIWRFCSNFTIFHNPKWRFKPHNGRFDHAQLDLIMKPLRNCFFSSWWNRNSKINQQRWEFNNPNQSWYFGELTHQTWNSCQSCANKLQWSFEEQYFFSDLLGNDWNRFCTWSWFGHINWILLNFVIFCTSCWLLLYFDSRWAHGAGFSGLPIYTPCIKYVHLSSVYTTFILYSIHF